MSNRPMRAVLAVYVAVQTLAGAQPEAPTSAVRASSPWR